MKSLYLEVTKLASPNILKLSLEDNAQEDLNNLLWPQEIKFKATGIKITFLSVDQLVTSVDHHSLMMGF